MKVTVDIADQHVLAPALATIEKVAGDNSTYIDEVKSLVDVAYNAACNCTNITPITGGNKEDTLKAIKKLENKVSSLVD
ncbi:hypothetical protein [Okeania sp. SIO2B3]|uniref:hypothetical protein n=1 Tax=Okeania sp. SIO2B3 TaxID=2607784 RepID=UPI0013BF55B0|nr:hypothetical protein [Okeania sp. SIO2B3]NET46632.1 hypothetical protein [Okeania sp. SIO2B3]